MPDAVTQAQRPEAQTPVRGRPRDASRDRAILAAARTVLAERGFTGASMDAIAQRAGVGKDTLYRRWSSKEALVRHLLSALAEEGIPTRSRDDDPRFGLFLFLQDVVRLNTVSDFGAVVAGVIGESTRNPKLAEVFQSFWAERRQFAGELVRQVIGPDASAQQIGRHVDQLMGPIYYRLLLSGDEITDEFLWDLVAALPWPDDVDHP